MENKVFREKSMDQISSTDELHDYMHVTSPKLWMILSVILVLIIGFIVYVSTVTMENSFDVPAVVEYADTNEDGIEDSMTITLVIPNRFQEVVKRGMGVRIGDETGTIAALLVVEDDDTQAVVFLDDEESKLPKGTYDATVVIESISPISFLLN